MGNTLKGTVIGFAGCVLFIILPLLGIAMASEVTILNRQFTIKELARLDIAGTAAQIISKQLPDEYQSYTDEIKQALGDLNPWIQQQIGYATNVTYDYLQGKSDRFNISLSLNPARDTLVKYLTQAYLRSPPPGFPTLPETELRRDLEAAIPADATLEINAESAGEGFVRALDTARSIFAFIHTSYLILLFAAIAFIIAIVATLREIRRTSLILGIILLFDGLLCAAVFFVVRYLAGINLASEQIPAQVQTWIPELISDTTYPLGIFSIGIGFVGLILLIVSIFLKRSGQVKNN